MAGSSSSPAIRACRTGVRYDARPRRQRHDGGRDGGGARRRYCEICSDVDGVYTADPRIVPTATRIATLSYEETQELAESGAKVLNAQAVEFAKEKGIAIFARATSSPLPGPNPSADGPSSGVIRRGSQAPLSASPARETCLSTNTLPAAQAERRPDPFGPGDVLALLDEHRVAGKQLHIAGDQLTLVVSRENLHAETRLREALAGRFGGSVRIADTLGAISVVGAGINASFENVRRGSAALAGSGAAIEAIATSSFRITWIIDRARLDEAVRLLHTTFIEAAR